MRLLLLPLAALSLNLLAADDSLEIALQGPDARTSLIPTLDRGYTLFSDARRLSVYKPDGTLHFARNDLGPVLPAAVDTAGYVAAGLGGSSGGAVVLLDANGRTLTQFRTDRYLPAGIAFGPDGSIWTIGWQRDDRNPQSEERDEDYSLVRRYSRQGKLLSASLPRSLFPGKLSPVGNQSQVLKLRVAGHRLGTILGAGQEGYQAEWVEWDEQGILRGRWPAALTERGYAWTATGRLVRGTTEAHLVELDRTSGTWQELGPAASGVLLDAYNGRLYFYRPGRIVQRVLAEDRR